MRYPLAYPQKRLWFLEQFDPGKSTYHVYGRFHLYGPLSIPALKQALHLVVQRHDVLRTAFGEEDGLPYQIVYPDVDLPFEFVDLRSTSKPKAEADRICGEVMKRPFDFYTPPLFRLLLLQVDEEQFEFLLVMHHIITDGSSREIF